MNRQIIFLIAFGVCLAGYIIPSMPSTNVPSTHEDTSIGVIINLSNAHTLLQIPCAAIANNMLHNNIDHTSPIIDYIPRFTFNISIQTLTECQSDSNSSRIEELQSFLHKMFPLAEVHHMMFTTFSKTTSLSNNDVIEEKVSLSNSVTVSTNKKKCNAYRGRLGSWKYNSTYGKTSWYVPSEWMRGSGLTNNGPYNHSSYTWEPSSDQQSDCPVDKLNLHGFCEATTSLNITRLFVLGDSIEFMRLVSSFHSMGMVSHVHDHLGSAMRYSYTFDCPSEGSSFAPVDLVFYRTNHLMPVKEGEVEGNHRLEYFACYGTRRPQFPIRGWCPWVQEYLEDPGRTLLVGAVGPHFHDLPYFREQFDKFVNLLELHRRPNDIVWLRTVLTGHENCTAAALTPIAPLENFDEYREMYQHDKNRWHEWNLFEYYNQYMELNKSK